MEKQLMAKEELTSSIHFKNEEEGSSRTTK